MITIREVKKNDTEIISLIASWYLQQWAIPIERTAKRLSEQQEDDIVFHLVLYKDGIPIATGGLHHKVGLLQADDRFKKYDPWVAVLYTIPEQRNSGTGSLLLKKIEDFSLKKGYETIYLYTFTAESLYVREGWKEMERVSYKGHDTVVMQKKLE